MATARATPDARERLLAAAFRVIRRQGYAGTTVDDLCREAGVTKGAFFHHFAAKDALAIAAAEHWSTVTGARFAAAPYHQPADPLDRVLAYLDFRAELLRGELPEFTCLVGTMAQETYATNDRIRAACGASIRGHADTLVADLEAARKRHRIRARWTAASLALHTQAVIQGAFVVAKALDDPQAAADSLAHLKRYVLLLFGRQP